jgi:serine/threonine-protein kinase
MMNGVRLLPVAACLAATALVLFFVLRVPKAQSVAPPVGAREVWSMYQSDPAHNAVFEQRGFRANWVMKLPDKINGGLAVVDGTIYVDSFDKALYALNAATGTLRWSAGLGNIVMSTPVVSDGVVIVGTGHDGFLKPNDATSQIWGQPQGDDVAAFSTDDGRLLWKVHTQGQDMPSPAIVGDTVIFANGDLHAYALDLHTGKRRWVVDLPGVATMASANVHDGMVFFSTCHNAPYVCETRAMDVRTGRTVWTNPFGGSDCSPAIDNGLVFTNGNRNDEERFHTGGVTIVAAIDERTGKTVWTHESEPGPYTFIASAERQIAGTAHRGVLYQPIGNAHKVVAFDERTGKQLWTFHTSANVKMSPVIKGDTVYFGDTGGIFYRVDRRNGKLIHATSYLQPFSTSPPVIVGDTIFVADGQMVVAAPLTDV